MEYHLTKNILVLEGGYNEFGLRAGTENVPGVVGFAKAVEIANESHIKYMKNLRIMLHELFA